MKRTLAAVAALLVVSTASFALAGEVPPSAPQGQATKSAEPTAPASTGRMPVALGLRWLAAHQLPDGGWSFDHAKAPKCKGQCPNPGRAADARVAAPSLALLPFFGAGQTHKGGKYKRTVKAALYFLVKPMKPDEDVDEEFPD